MNKVFLDTNILLYSCDATDSDKQRISRRIVHNSIERRNTWISYQVLGECANVMIRKLHMERTNAIRILHYFNRLKRVDFNFEILTEALNAREAHQLSFWDSMITATALDADCDTLFSEDMSHGQLISNVQIINPFRDDLIIDQYYE